MAVDEKTQELLGTGRRKSATARVRLKPGGSGKITINRRNAENYFPICERVRLSKGGGHIYGIRVNVLLL